MKLTLHKYKLLKLSIIFYMLLSVCFFYVINNLWNFQRFSHVVTDISFYYINYLKYIFVSTIIVFNFFLISFLKIKDFLYVILSLILILFVTPSGVIYSVDSDIDLRIFFSHNMLFYGVLLTSFIDIKIPLKEFSTKTSFFLLLWIIIIGLIPYLRFLPYIDLRNLLLQNVYETREVFSKIKDPYFGYTYGWFNRFIIPSLFVFAIYLKSKRIAILTLFLLIYLYLLGAHKSVLYGTVLVIVFYRYNYLTIIKFIYKGIITLIILSIILAVFFDNNLLAIFTIRRALFIPSLLDLAYFDLFDGNYQYWSEGVLKGITEYSYDKSHTYIISEKYFQQGDMASNNGIISDGFMNAGMIGVTLNIMIVSLYFSIMNKLNISSKFFGLFIFLFVSLISSSLTTILLTHGAIVLLILAFVFLKNTEEKFI